MPRPPLPLFRLSPLLAGAVLIGLVPPTPALAGKHELQELLYATEGNRLHRVDLDTVGRGAPLQDVLIERNADDPDRGRDVNGMICALPDGGGFVLGEDTDQPSPPAGWGIFAPSGTQLGKLTATYFVPGAEPFGCAFAPDGTLFTTEVGAQDFGEANGQLILWFPPYGGFPGPPLAYPATDEPSANFCKIATDIGTATGVAVDDQGRVYVASSSGFEILRFSPPFPTGPDAAGGCGGVDALGSPVADAVQREVFADSSQGEGMFTFTGLALSAHDTLYAASVLTGRVGEYDLDGHFLRLVVDPPEAIFPTSTGTPQGLAVGGDGTLYYADLDLVGSLPANVDTGPDGKVWRVRFRRNGEPLPPEVVLDGLAFPDGVAVLPGDLERKGRFGRKKSEWRSFAGGPSRQFFQARGRGLSKKSAARLVERWRFRTGSIVTGSPAVAALELPGEGRAQVVYFTSWDGHLYAVRLADGSELWHVAWDPQPGASFPASGSPHAEEFAGRTVVFAGLGEHLHAVDAVTGQELWRFAAGTGCRDALGQAPGACAFDGERNEVETSPVVADGKVFFGMDVNDSPLGKGGFYAVDAATGALAWFFDLETGATCTPRAGDEIRSFDGYHGEAELGLPAGFLASRPGCDFDRTPTGCGNVWSSPALDPERGLLYFGSSNCDTDDDAGTTVPPPPMPPFDEGLTALRLDGTPAWRWRPREVDNEDLAFGATPNLFRVRIGKRRIDVVGIGGKDGTYYLLDRDGENELTGVAWDDADPLALPYWSTNVVPGGFAGGIIGTPAVDEKRGRIYFATGPGVDPMNPQQPTVHALDARTGAVLWENDGSQPGDGDSAFGPTAATAKLVFVGSVVAPRLRIYDAATGELLAGHLVGDALLGSAIASGAVPIDGTVLVGTGIGTLTGNPSSPSEITARFPSSLVALCVAGKKGCPKE
jgi:outer membrane protein assembly factor BamB